MKGAILCFILAGLVALFMAWLLIGWAAEKIAHAREQRALRIRAAELKRFSMGPFRGTKDRFLS